MDLRDLRRIGLFARTDDAQLLALRAAGSEIAFECGDVLFHENHPAESWWVLLDGSIDLVRHVRNDETRLGAMDVPGQWAGGFRAWDEHGAYLATGRATTAGRILRVDRHRGDIGVQTRHGETVLRVRLPTTGAGTGREHPARTPG